MSKFFVNKMIVVLFFSLAFLNVYSYANRDIKRIRVTKEIYNNHYKNFEKYIFHNRSELWWGRKTRTVTFGAKVLGYNDFTIKCIPLSYSFFDRNPQSIQQILRSLVADECLYHINVLLEKCSEKPGDLDWVARVTYEEGRRLEQEEMRITGRSVSVLTTDTFVAVGLFVRYCVEKKLSL